MLSKDDFLEKALVYRCRAGDDEAFARLVELHHGSLLYYARRLLGNASGAEDVVQEAWLAVYRQMRRLKDVAAFRTWLYRIVRNRAFDVLRVRPMVSMESLTEPLIADEPVFLPEEAAQVHLALGRLTLEHREVLTLRFLEGMSYEQIAAVTDTGLGTVKSRVFRAKQLLRREMEQMS